MSVLNMAHYYNPHSTELGRGTGANVYRLLCIAVDLTVVSLQMAAI